MMRASTSARWSAEMFTTGSYTELEEALDFGTINSLFAR